MVYRSLAFALLGLALCLARASAQTSAPASAPAWAPATAPSKPPAVAIICIEGKTVDPSQLDAILAADFVSSKAFRLVERTAIDKVFEEKTLTKLFSADGAMDVGKMIGADLLLIIEQVGNDSLRAVRIKVVETASGIIFRDSTDTLAELAAKPEPLRLSLDEIARRVAVPQAQRIVVGFAGVWSEDPGSSLDFLLKPYELFIRHYFTHASRVVPLEREQMQKIAAERELGGIEKKLRASTIFVDVSIKRGAKPETLEATLNFHRDGFTKKESIQVIFPDGSFDALRTQVADRILKHVDAGPASAEEHADDARAEAATLSSRSRLLMKFDRPADALAMAEAACAMDSLLLYKQRAQVLYEDYAETYKLKLLDRLRVDRRAVEFEFQTIKAVCDANDIEGIERADYRHKEPGERTPSRIYLRPKHKAPDPSTLTAEEYRDRVSHMEVGTGRLSVAYFTGHMFDFFPLAAAPKTEEEKIVAELVALKNRELDMLLEARKRNKMALSPIMRARLSPFLIRTGPQFVIAAKVAIEQYRLELRTGLIDRKRSPELFGRFSNIMTWLKENDDVAGNFKAAEIKPLFAWMSQQPEPWLRAAGYDLLTFFPDPDVEKTAVRALDTYLRGKVSHDDYLPLTPHADSRQNAMSVLAKAGKLADYYSTLLNEYEKNGTGYELIRFRRAVRQLYTATIPQSAAIEHFKRLDKISHQKPVPELYAAEDKGWRENLAEWTATAQKRIDEKAGTLKNPWDNFTATEIKMPENPEGTVDLCHAYLDVAAKPPTMILVWCGAPEEKLDGLMGNARLTVTSMPLMGGPQTQIATGVFKRPYERPTPAVTDDLYGYRIIDLVSTPDGLFIADVNSALLVVRDGKITEWTEKTGFASTNIWSLAYCDGRLFAGLRGGFAEIDPKTGKATLLGNCKLLTPRNALDAGDFYTVSRIIPAPSGKSLWLSIGGDYQRGGLWRFDLKDGSFTHVVKNAAEVKLASSAPVLSLQEGKLVLLGLEPGFYDAETGQRLSTFPRYKRYFLGGDGKADRRFITSQRTPGEGSNAFSPTREAGKSYFHWVTETRHDADVFLGDILITNAGDYQDPKGDAFSSNKHPFHVGNRGLGWDTMIRYSDGVIVVNYGLTKFPRNAWYLVPPAAATATAPATGPAKPPR